METLVRIFDETLLACDKLLVVVRVGQLDIHRSGGYVTPTPIHIRQVVHDAKKKKKKKGARKATIFSPKPNLY
jgi:hypothetical protein